MAEVFDSESNVWHHPLEQHFRCWESLTGPLPRLRGCCSYLSKRWAWSSSQFRVTLPYHAGVESNLLWWKDKETLIEILPPGHLGLSFHMGLDKLFSTRLAVRAVSDPSFTTMNKTRREFVRLIPHGCVTQQSWMWIYLFCAAVNTTI